MPVLCRRADRYRPCSVAVGSPMPGFAACSQELCGEVHKRLLGDFLLPDAQRDRETARNHGQLPTSKRYYNRRSGFKTDVFLNIGSEWVFKVTALERLHVVTM